MNMYYIYVWFVHIIWFVCLCWRLYYKYIYFVILKTIKFNEHLKFSVKFDFLEKFMHCSELDPDNFFQL